MHFYWESSLVSTQNLITPLENQLGNSSGQEWGLVQQPNNVSPIGVSVDGTGTPTYSFNPNQTETFGYDSSLASRWQMQFGLRYIF